MTAQNFADDLLQWYDANARALPWRIPPAQRKTGALPDPYRVWVSEVMLQQTTVAHARPYFERFMQTWPTINAFAKADPADIMAAWAGLGYYARARNMLKCAQEVVALGGFPRNRQALLKLSGVGAYTSAAIAAIAFDQAEAAIDANVDRIITRIFDIETPLTLAKKDIATHANALVPRQNCGAFAEAMMDLGATICTPNKPNCTACPVAKYCAAYQNGTQAARPVKLPKKARPSRFGHVYILQNDTDQILAETRPDTGLLGGMAGLPTSDWLPELAQFSPPISGDWQGIGSYKHVFTHFTLHITVWQFDSPHYRPTQTQFWLAKNQASALPTAFKKAVGLIKDQT